MTDIYEIWAWITCGLILGVWAAFSWSRWYIERRYRRMQHFERLGWDSRQDYKHRIARRGWVRRLKSIENGRKAMAHDR